MQPINTEEALKVIKNAKDDIASIETEAPVMLTQCLGYVRSKVTLKDSRSAQAVSNFYLSNEGKLIDRSISIEEAELAAILRALSRLGYEINNVVKG